MTKRETGITCNVWKIVKFADKLKKIVLFAKAAARPPFLRPAYESILQQWQRLRGALLAGGHLVVNPGRDVLKLLLIKSVGNRCIIDGHLVFYRRFPLLKLDH